MDVNLMEEEALKAIEEAKDLATLENLRIKYLSKKGLVQGLLAEMKNLPKEEKPQFGQVVNKVKEKITSALEAKSLKLNDLALDAQLEKKKIDLSLDAYTP